MASFMLRSWWSYAAGWSKPGRRTPAPTNSSSTASGTCPSSARRTRWSRWALTGVLFSRRIEDRAVPVSVVWGLSCVRLCLITNRLVSEDPNGSGNWLLAPARSTSVLLLTLNTIKSLLGFSCMTNSVFPVEVMFVFVASIVKETKNWISQFPVVGSTGKKSSRVQKFTSVTLTSFDLILELLTFSFSPFKSQINFDFSWDGFYLPFHSQVRQFSEYFFV